MPTAAYLRRPMFPSAHLPDRPTERPRVRPWLIRVVTTLAAWLVAFSLITTLLTLFGGELASLPLALRALVLSGVLVSFMANLVMPVLSAAVARWEMSISPPAVRPTTDIPTDRRRTR
jgi:antibiotic biosynthesis monooxygenase (ABM) superfamily enzyme